MQLTVPDAACLLRVSEETVYRWIREENLPATRFNDRYHFNRARLIEWAHEHRIAIASDEKAGLPTLRDALVTGGVIHGITETCKAEILRRVVDTLRLPEDADREFLYEMLMARERQGSTGFGGGIAIPHPRRPILIHGQPPSVTVGYLEPPADFSAVDGQPVFALFIMVTPTVPIHLHLLSRLGQALRHPAFLEAVQRRAGLDELLRALPSSDLQHG